MRRKDLVFVLSVANPAGKDDGHGNRTELFRGDSVPSPGGGVQVSSLFPTGQPESRALSSYGFMKRELPSQASQVQTSEGTVALLRW